MKIPWAPIKRLLLIFSNSDCLMGKSFEFFTCRTCCLHNQRQMPASLTYIHTNKHIPTAPAAIPSLLTVSCFISLFITLRVQQFSLKTICNKKTSNKKRKKNCSQCAYATHVATTAATTAALQRCKQGGRLSAATDNRTIRQSCT